MFQDLPQLRKESIMPGVGKMKFPYTSKGITAAKKAAKKTGMKYKKTLSKTNGNKKGLGKVKPMKNIPKKK
jgi:hypothetical protein